MGGDQGSRLVVDATLAFLQFHPDVVVTLVGDECFLKQSLPESLHADILSRVFFLHAEDTIAMAEKAGDALRSKQSSSMWRAVALVAEGHADACVSGGNTGALMAIGCKLIGTFDGVRRPAICKLIPTYSGTSLLLDLGANINCSAEQLEQFGVMGSALAQLGGVQRPSVALLNIGTERSKGSSTIQAAAEALRARDDIAFAGFIEGNDLYSGKVDVVVCDGLVGNVALKVSEGVVNLVMASLAETFRASIGRRLLGWALRPILSNWRKSFNPTRYNGAAFLGLRRTLVKSHGAADKEGFEQALNAAVGQVVARIPERIEACLERR